TRGTSADPGRVDPPPMSRMSAPSSTMLRARLVAASASGSSPPSENESGVTFTIPITRVRSPHGSTAGPHLHRRGAPFTNAMVAGAVGAALPASAHADVAHR